MTNIRLFGQIVGLVQLIFCLSYAMSSMILTDEDYFNPVTFLVTVTGRGVLASCVIIGSRIGNEKLMLPNMILSPIGLMVFVGKATKMAVLKEGEDYQEIFFMPNRPFLIATIVFDFVCWLLTMYLFKELPSSRTKEQQEPLDPSTTSVI